MKYLRWFAVAVLIAGVTGLQAITYDEAVNQAMTNNPGLSLADLGIDEAEENLIQTRSAFSPQVKFQGSYTRLGTVPVMILDFSDFSPIPMDPVEMPMGTADNYSAGFQVSVPIFLGGKRSWAEEMARLGIDSAEEDAVMARTKLHAQVNAAFYGLMLAEEAEKIADADLKRAEKQHEETKARWKVGYASPLDLKSDEVAVSQARAALLEAENRTLQAQHFLNMVLGQDISTPVTAEGSFDITHEELGADSLVRRALRERPEMKALDRAERITELSGNLARSAYSPSLVFVTSPGWQNPYQTLEGWGYSMSATVALEWPLYDGGKGLSQARVAGINSKKLVYTRSQAADGIELEVRSAYASWQEAAQQLIVQERLGEQMVELASMADEQYRMGVISALDYQDIMFNKTQVELARLASLYQMIIAREDLINAAWLWDEQTLEELLKPTEEQK